MIKTFLRFQKILAACAGFAALSVHTLHAQANYSLSLSGSSQYVSVPANASLTPSSAFTLEAWIKVPGTGVQTIVSRGDGGNGSITDYIFQLSNNGAGSGNEVSLFAGGAWDDSISIVPLNTWTHVAVTFDGQNKRFYINGVLDRTAPRTNSIYSTPSSPMYIGRQGSVCNCNFFHGSIAEVQVWSTIRTAAQINADMNFSLVGSQPGLVAYYHLDEGSGTTAIDATGNGNTGTLQNSATWANSGLPYLGTTNVVEGPAAGVESVVLSSLGTSWTAKTNATWLHLSAGYQSGTSSTNVVFSFDANTTSDTRTGAVVIAGQTLTVTQAASNYVAATPVTTLVSSGLSNPQGVAVDRVGNVYIADTGDNAIKVWWPASNTVTTLVSSGLNGPNGVVVDVAGNVYIADTTNNMIKEWVAASNTVTTLVSSGLNHPVAVAVDGVGNVYFADYGNGVVKEWSVINHTVTTLISSPFVSTPTSVAVDGAGNVYATDHSTAATIKWSATSHTPDVYLSYPSVFIGDPNGIVVDGNGNLFLADEPSTIREWSPTTGNTTPLFSTGVNNNTLAVAVDGNRNVYICDTPHNSILELSRAYVNPTTRSEPLAAGGDALPVVLPATINLLPPFAPSTDQPWLNVTNVTNGVVSFTFAANSTNRVGHIGMLGQSITVSQFNNMLNLGVCYVGPAGGTSNVVLTVESAGPQGWTATSQASWLHLPVSSGSGSASVSFTIDPNPGITRTATLTIGDQTFVVIQEPLALGWYNRVEGPGAGADSVVLSSLGAPWTATTNVPWLHLSAGNQSGTGSQNVVFTFDANTGVTRTGTLTIAGMTLTITQGGSNYVATTQVTTLAAYPYISIPYGAAVDSSGNVIIADPQGHRLQKWSLANNSVSTLFSVDSASFPDSVALDAAGNIFFSSYNSGLIQEWSAASNTVATLPINTGTMYPEGVAVDGAGNVYASGNTLLQFLAANQAVVNLPAGNPIGLALDAAGNAYFSEYGLMELPVGSQNPVTLNGGSSFFRGVAVDGGGNVYVADDQNTVNAILVFSPATQSVSTIISGLNFPESAAVDALGNVYAVNSSDSAIQELPRAFVDSSPKIETSAAGNDSLAPVLPTSENLSAPFAPSSDQSWLTITGITNGVVSFAFSTNSGGTRTGHITILGQSVPVTQLTYIALNPIQRMEGPGGGSDSFSITSLNNPWTATANVSWLHLSAGYQSGTTSTNVVFTFDTNPGPTRVGTITIAGQTFTVVQEAVALAASSRLEGPAAGSDSILLQSVNAPWTATTNAPWLHLSSGYQSGTSSTNVVFSFDANTGITRTGSLTIAGLTLSITQAGSNYVAAPGPITLVSSNLSQPNGMAADGAGNVYIADSAHNAVKEWCVASNTVITLTTNGLNYPYGVAVDAAGNVFVDDFSGNTLRKWSPLGGTVTVLTTNGLNGPEGISLDDAGNVYLADRNSYLIKEWSATASNVTTVVSGLNYPQDVTVDFLGDLFIVDSGNNAIKQWSVTSGAVTTLVSYPGANLPYDVAADAGANLYFVDQTEAVKKWSPASTSLTTNYSALSHSLNAVALDSAGNLYFADLNYTNSNYSIKELPHAFVDPTPKFESYAAGNDVLPVVVPATQNLLGPCAPSSDQPWLTITGVTNGVVSFAFTTSTSNRTANINLLGQIIPVTQFSYVLSANLLFVGPASGSNSVGLMVSADAIQSWTASSDSSWLHLVTTSGSGGGPVGFTFDANPGARRSGTLTIAGQTLAVIQDVLSLGETARVEGPAAGSDSVILTSINSPWVASTNVPWLHLSAGFQSGNTSTNVVFSFDANTGTTRTGALTIAGLTLTLTQAASNYVAATPLTSLVGSGLSSPQGVAVDGAGNVYIADSGNNAIKEWVVASNTVITLVTNGLNDPYGVAVDGAGNVYIADTFNNVVKEWVVASNTVTTLISAGLNEPTGVAVDGLGNVYIADGGNGAVKEWSAMSQTVTTLFSDPSSGPYSVTADAAGNVYFLDIYANYVRKWSATSGSVTTLISSGLNNPEGLAVDGAGNIYISDNVIRVWSAASNIVSTVRGIFTVGVAVDGIGNVYVINGVGRILEIPRAFVDPSAKLESPAGGNDALSVVLPATENLLAPFAPSNSQPWLTITGVTNGAVSFAFADNTAPARTNIITLLGQHISVAQSAFVAPTLINAHMLGNGSFQFAFTNVPGASFSVWSATNLSLPLSNWTALGSAVEGPPGKYVFTDNAPTNSPRFYTVRFP